MRENIERSDENQDRLDKEQEKSDGNPDQLMEIYRLQTQLVNNINNRRVTINRFYMLGMSGLALICSAFFKLPDSILEGISVDFFVIAISVLGLHLSWVWFASVNSNLRLVMLKYESLKRLEDKLEYQFFQDEWTFLKKYGKDRPYWEISSVEIVIPFLFFFTFGMFMKQILQDYPDIVYSKFAYYPVIITYFLVSDAYSSWQTDREIRGMDVRKRIKLNVIINGIALVWLLILALRWFGVFGQ